MLRLVVNLAGLQSRVELLAALLAVFTLPAEDLEEWPEFVELVRLRLAKHEANFVLVCQNFGDLEERAPEEALALCSVFAQLNSIFSHDKLKVRIALQLEQ